MKNAGSPASTASIGFVIATKRIAEDEHKVCFMYRETPIDPQDSGWRLFSGDESQEYVNNPDNSGIYQPINILMIDSSIEALLDEPIGSAFERVDGTSEWMPAADYNAGNGDEIERQEIGGGWQIAISGIFDRYEEEEGDTVFAAHGRTARIAIWDFSEKSPEEVISIHREFIQDRDQTETPTIESFETAEDGVLRIGFLVEESDEERTYKVIYGYTIIGCEVAQGAYYFDVDTDRDWAMDTWNSVTA
jgi:hypothetical protein